jgi:hypothetical protein
MCETSYAQFEGFLLTLAGFLLFVLWDIIKSHFETRTERERIMSLLVTEIKENRDICAGIVDHLSKEIKLLGERQEIVPAPTTLEVEGWAIGKSGNILKFLGWEKTRVVAKCCATARRINMNIQSREILRSTSRALSGYRELVRAFDETIISQSMQYVRESVEALNVLGEKTKELVTMEPM